MRILVYLGHPAHFYLYKNAIVCWREAGNQVEILIKKKDILQQLLDNQGWRYHNILQEGRGNFKLGMLIGMIKRAWRINRFCAKFQPHVLTGTSVENSFIGKLRGIPVINCNEDDAAVVPLYAKLSYPWANAILNPKVCNSGKWDNQAIKYNSYQELAYLHPNHFIPLRDVVESYGIDTTKPYFILRFASLTAHHDKGISGINNTIAANIIKLLYPNGKIYITSERPLSAALEPYRIRINPLDMHHVMAFASLYIGDSQTMAAEAGVLGIPFIRFNDFVGRIGYLRELEEIYQLGIGIRASAEGATEKLYEATRQLVELPAEERVQIYTQRRERMLADKIDYAKFLTWFIENYPESKEVMKTNPDYQFRFR